MVGNLYLAQIKERDDTILTPWLDIAITFDNNAKVKLFLMTIGIFKSFLVLQIAIQLSNKMKSL